MMTLINMNKNFSQGLSVSAAKQPYITEILVRHSSRNGLMLQVMVYSFWWKEKPKTWKRWQMQQFVGCSDRNRHNQVIQSHFFKQNSRKLKLQKKLLRFKWKARHLLWELQSSPTLTERRKSCAEREDKYYHSEWPHLSSGGSIFLMALK